MSPEFQKSVNNLACARLSSSKTDHSNSTASDCWFAARSVTKITPAWQPQWLPNRCARRCVWSKRSAQTSSVSVITSNRVWFSRCATSWGCSFGRRFHGAAAVWAASVTRNKRDACCATWSISIVIIRRWSSGASETKTTGPAISKSLIKTRFARSWASWIRCRTRSIRRVKLPFAVVISVKTSWMFTRRRSGQAGITAVTPNTKANRSRRSRKSITFCTWSGAATVTRAGIPKRLSRYSRATSPGKLLTNAVWIFS